MKVVILGFGNQGKSSLEYWQKLGADVTVADSNTDLTLPDGVTGKLGPNYLENLDQYDLIVRTPIIHPRQILQANPESSNILDKVTSNTNEFFRVCPSKNIIAVTGTKGKGTTCTLIAKMLEASGHTAHLIGNIGTPPLEIIDQIEKDDWVVMELANFQLIDLKYSPHIAVCVMVEPEHLDWHEDVDEYISAKQQLFIHQEESDIAIYYANNENSEEIANATMGKIISYMGPDGADVKDSKEIWIDGKKICETDEIKLIGKHNWQNICAAVTAVWQIDQNIDAIRKVISEFSGMEYRIEHIFSVNGVDFYNDSFGTTPETAIVAVEAMMKPTILILGGSDKGVEYNKLADGISENNVKKVILVGAMANKIKSALENAGYMNYVLSKDNMADIVNQAVEIAESGDAVLLSPACASFDMFENYKDRGDQFNQAVKSLS